MPHFWAQWELVLHTAASLPSYDRHYRLHTGIRASLEDFASNFWNWKEKAAISLLQKVLQGCDDHFEISFVAAAATAEAHTWKVTAIVLGSVLAAVLLVAAGLLVVRARSNSGSAIVGAGAGAGAGTSSSAGGQSGTELM